MYGGSSTQQIGSTHFIQQVTECTQELTIFVLTYNSDRHRIRECNIGIRDFSDHLPAYITLHLDNKKKNTFWHFNTCILNDNACKNYVQKEFKDYIDNNNNGEVSPSVLLDAAKSVIRGKLIAYTLHKKNERDKKAV